MHITEPLFNGDMLTCELQTLGNDLNLCVFSNKTAHVGSVVVSYCVPRIHQDGTTVTSSVITLAGHKDEAIARLFAEKAAAVSHCTVVCTCGVHIDNPSSSELENVISSAKKLLDKLCLHLDTFKTLSSDA